MRCTVTCGMEISSRGESTRVVDGWGGVSTDVTSTATSTATTDVDGRSRRLRLSRRMGDGIHFSIASNSNSSSSSSSCSSGSCCNGFRSYWTGSIDGNLARIG